MSNPRNLQELADSLAAIANTRRLTAGKVVLSASSYDAGYRDALLDTRSTVLAMIESEREIIFGRSYYVIQEGDVGKPSIRAFGKTWMVGDFLGRVLPGDVGKRIYQRAGVLSVENDQQRDERLARRDQGTE